MQLVTFDFWNTLFQDVHEEIRHQKRIRFAHGTLRKHRAIEVEAVEEAFASAHQQFSGQWESREAFTMSLHFRFMLDYLAHEIPEDDFRSVVDYFESVLLEHPPLIIRNAHAAVMDAAARGKTGLISDTGYSPGRTLRMILLRHEMDFHSFSFSNETGFLKPKPETFHKILNELDVDPKQAVHIGDLEDTDIAGAKQVGMKAIKYIGTNPSATRESIADAVIEDLAELPSILDRF